jgi:hypothetical protein
MAIFLYRSKVCDHRLFPLTSSHKLRSVRFWGTSIQKEKLKRFGRPCGGIRDAIPLPKGKKRCSLWVASNSKHKAVQCAAACLCLASSAYRVRRCSGCVASRECMRALIRSAVPIDAAARRVDRPLPRPTQGARVQGDDSKMARTWVLRYGVGVQSPSATTLFTRISTCI